MCFYFRDKTSEEATYDVINNQLVCVKELMDSGKLHVDNIDVFCEKFVFDINQSRAILEAGQKCGLAINFHGDELSPLKGAEVRDILKLTYHNYYSKAKLRKTFIRHFSLYTVFCMLEKRLDNFTVL